MIISTNNPLFVKSVETIETPYGYIFDIHITDEWSKTDYYIVNDILYVEFDPLGIQITIQNDEFEKHDFALYTDEYSGMYSVACMKVDREQEKTRKTIWHSII